MNKNRTYLAIDLKSFYASVEAVERGLDPMTTNLVVADKTRTAKTICLAVSPSLKAYGISGRARLFEVIQAVDRINAERRNKQPDKRLHGLSIDAVELELIPERELSYLTASPRMALYIEYSTRIYNIYLRHIAPEDIHVYSIDEVFMDVTDYLNTYQMSARDLAKKMMQEVLEEIGITATAGIGTNLYLCKIAMDIMAKHVEPDMDGVRIAELDEMTYRRLFWDHRPLTDFWRVGRGISKKLAKHEIYTMGDIARCSLGSEHDYYNEELLYKLFGVNAELLIDHAWGYEPCTIADVKAYKPENNSLGSGQVLHCPYTVEKARLIAKEMTDLLSYDLLAKHLVTDQLVLTVGYDMESLNDPEIRKQYHGEVKTDYYGRSVPKHAHGTTNLGRHTSSTRLLTKAITELYDQIVNPLLLVRRVNICANHVIPESSVVKKDTFEQLDLFTDYTTIKKEQEKEEKALEKERRRMQAVLELRNKYGKNIILKGMNFEDGATTRDRNRQIGGHKA